MPPELAGGGPYAELTPLQVLENPADGQQVRWGGAIVQALPRGESTCFEMTGLALDSRGEPLDSDRSTGRFLACSPGFFDPAIYDEGRMVTFTGRLQGTAPQRIGEQEYRFPRLEADQVYLWPKHSEVIYVPYPAPYWGPYYDPYYWSPRVRPRDPD